jgi:hypothetical protein
MEKEFIPMDLALRLKALGFDEPCFGFYSTIYDLIIGRTNGKKSLFDSECLAPTFSQAFRFFREKYNTCVEIHETTDWEEDNESWSFVIFKYKLGDNDGMISSTIDYDTYEEAELACLTKLIEIVESKTK